jgi:adenylate kinase family enzyme
VNRSDIITELYLSKDINEAIGKMQPYELQDDLRQEVFLVLCEMDEERLLKMYKDGYLKYFVVRTIVNMAKSDRSNFARTFRKVYEEVGDLGSVEPYDDSITEKLNKSMEVLHWYEEQIFKLYAESGNLLQVSRDTKIPYRSLLKTVKKVKTLLKYKIRNSYAHD